MPNLAEWYFGNVVADNDAPWQPYGKTPAERYQQFHDRLRQSENIIVNDGKPADGRALLDEIRMLSETRHDAPEPEQRGPRSYRSP